MSKELLRRIKGLIALFLSVLLLSSVFCRDVLAAEEGYVLVVQYSHYIASSGYFSPNSYAIYSGDPSKFDDISFTNQSYYGNFKTDVQSAGFSLVKEEEKPTETGTLTVSEKNLSGKVYVVQTSGGVKYYENGTAVSDEDYDGSYKKIHSNVQKIEMSPVKEGRTAYRVDITASLSVTAITIKSEGDVSKINTGSDLQLSIVKTPEDAEDPEIEWSSGDESIAKVNSTTGKVTGISAGTAVITAKVKGSSPEISNTFNLTVLPKPAAVVTTKPSATNPTADGTAKELVTAGVAEGGTMNYALGTDTATVPASGWSASIPTGTEAKTYYVWYKAKGDDSHSDSEAAYVESVIKGKDTPEIKNDSKLPEAEKDKAYSVKLELKDSTVQNTDWTVTDSSLPEGLSLDSKTGEISGTPSKAGEYAFTIKERTSGAEKKFSLTVKSGEEPGPAAEIKTDSTLPEAKPDEDYEVTLELKDSTVQDMNWEVTKGSLPEGLSLDSKTGKISGKPSKEGEYVFTVKETNTGAEKEFNLTVKSSGSKKEEKKSSKRDTEEHKTASWILNPNEKQQLVITYTGTPAYLAAGYQEQGAAATELFKAAVPAGWIKAFSFNVLDQKRQPELSIKTGVMTLFVPGEFINAKRQYALLGMNKAGQVILFADTDQNLNTVTVNLANMDGYAFELIYKD